MKYTDEQLKELMQKHPTHSNYKLGEELGVCENSIRQRKTKLAKAGWSPEHNWTNTVPDGYKVSGVSSYVDGEGNVLRQWVKSSEDKARQIEILKEMCKGFLVDLPKYKPVTIYNEHEADENLMLVLPIGDLHVGMMSWKDETGNDWSIDHVKAAVFHVFKMLIEQAPQIQKILIINLGDFAHRDGKNAVTPMSGHHLDVDSRYPKMVRVCIELIRFIIDTALLKAPEVEIKNVGGNHDNCVAVWLSEMLSNTYEKEPRLTVDTNPGPVKYCEWGKVMIATTHGDTIKMERLPGVVANDQSEMWGRTKFRYGMTGHIHSSNKVSKEFTGMLVESFRTLAAGDSFAAWYGWRSGQDSHGLLFDKKLGSRGRNEIGIVMIEDILDRLGEN